MNWLMPLSDQEQQPGPDSFSLDGRASAQQIVGHAAEETNADGIGPLIGIYEDDERD